MATKKKYTVLNIQQRLDVLKDLQETSLSAFKIGKKYGVNAKTIQRIKKNAEKINAFADKNNCERKRRKIIEPVYDELDKRLLEWFIERRTLCDHITDALMLEKATELKNHFPSCSSFKVSRGWLSKFKKRHGIRLTHMYKEIDSTDKNGANTFIDQFNKLIQEENINLENVYNMSESWLVWKALPTRIPAGDEERNVNGYKLQKDRVTIGLCANALGTHKIMPLVIHKYKSPRALKHEVSLPVVFKSQANACMDQTLFSDWYENYFKPSVREYQLQNQISGKVVLLLNNRESYKLSPKMQEDEHFRIMYLSSNSTSLIQPMDQGIMEKTKRVFRHKILQRALTYDNGVNEFYEDYTLKNCIDILSKSWSEITQNDIRNAWDNIIGHIIPLNHISIVPSNHVPIVPSNYVQPITKLETDWQDMMSVIAEKECTQQHVTNYLSLCEEAEKRHEGEQIEEVTVFKEEPPEEPPEIIYQDHNNEIAKKELQKIFERLTFYSARAPTCIQYMVQGLKMFFVGKEH